MEVGQEIHRRIRQRGKITFAEFMELALYWPGGGYYSSSRMTGQCTGNNIGLRGDFYTAPAAHPAFGALLCLQMFQMWRVLGSPRTFWVVEMGAGSGLLCRDVVEYAALLSRAFFQSLRYVCLDRTTSHGLESQMPAGFTGMVDRLATDGVPLRGLKGCFLSNELVDSFPVHRVTLRDGELKEVYLALEGQHLVETLDTPSTPALKERLDSLGASLTEGDNAEICLALAPWVEQVSSALERGFHVTIDYGHAASELYSPLRSRGTLTCFYKHTQTANPYQRIGQQDITVQVDFTSLMQVGRRCGLEPLGLVSQREFLCDLGLRQLMGRLPAMGLGQGEADANRMGMLELIKPEGMGNFKVLVQAKGVGRPELSGLGPSPQHQELVKAIPAPLLNPHHMPLLEGRYPHAACRWDSLWPTGLESISKRPLGECRGRFEIVS